MARFFFDFHQHGRATHDETGVEFESAEAAYLAAVDGAHGLWGELLKKRQDPRLCSFEIRGESGAVLFTLPFSELLDNCRDARVARQGILASLQEAKATHAFAEKVRDELTNHLRETRETLRQAKELLATPVP